jgi:hypothetical protein
VEKLNKEGKGVDDVVAAAVVSVTSTTRRVPLHLAVANGNAEMSRFPDRGW